MMMHVLTMVFRSRRLDEAPDAEGEAPRETRNALALAQFALGILLDLCSGYFVIKDYVNLLRIAIVGHVAHFVLTCIVSWQVIAIFRILIVLFLERVRNSPPVRLRMCAVRARARGVLCGAAIRLHMFRGQVVCSLQIFLTGSRACSYWQDTWRRSGCTAASGGRRTAGGRCAALSKTFSWAAPLRGCAPSTWPRWSAIRAARRMVPPKS